jgi:UDPglucose 6-dehydrogenase
MERMFYNMNIAVIGTGYVGLVTGTCLASIGHRVICVDNNEEKVQVLRSGKSPIYEMGLEELMADNVAQQRLLFTSDIRGAIEQSDVIFVAVGTPIDKNGQTNMAYVHEVIRQIGEYIDGYKVIVNKSTVPVGTGQYAEQAIRAALQARGLAFGFDVASNPEFLREGTAIHDFQHPDRIVVGAMSEKAFACMRELYAPFIERGLLFVETNIETAELIKFVANGFLAMKVAFINQVANLCEKVGADIHDLKVGIGSDARIGRAFLNPGPGYGGSCFPKDATALCRTSEEAGVPLTLIQETIVANEQQKHYMVEKMVNVMGDLTGKTLAILGVAFKANTDDMRESPSITILQELASRGAKFRVYDPQAEHQARIVFRSIEQHIVYCADEYEAAQGADAVVLLTEWARFGEMDLERLKTSLQGRVFFDYRNMYRREAMEAAGFVYTGAGQ